MEQRQFQFVFAGASLEVKLVRSFPENVGWNIKYDFVYFSDLQQLAAAFSAKDILFSLRVFYSNSS